MTTRNSLIQHWPVLDAEYVKLVRSMKKKLQILERPNCEECGVRCWWTQTERRFRHDDGRTDPVRFAHTGGETVDDI